MFERGISGQKADIPGAAIASGNFTHRVRLAGCIGVIAIIVVSLVPIDWRPSTGLAKEWEHGIAYWIVAAVLTIAGVARWPRILAMPALAAALEFGQRFVPGRDSNVFDFLASSAGALLGYGCCSLAMALASRYSARGLRDRLAAWFTPFRLEVIAAAVAAGVLAVAVSITAAHGAAGGLGAGLALAMLAIAVIDAQYFLIPDPLNVAGLALGMVNSAVLGWGDLAALGDAVLRAAVLAAAFLGLRLLYARLRGRHGIGLGDIKLAAVAGTWLDWSVMPIAVEIAALSALAIYALRRYVLNHPPQPSARLPFGLYFAPAIWIGWLLQTTVLRGW
jgi:leader peptidase (prepilin peptidase)/N-methyltransferase